MRRKDLEYAINDQKSITTQVFRREHKDDNWYVHLTTYVQDIPIVHTIKNGCLGIDFNANSLSVTYVKNLSILKLNKFRLAFSAILVG